MSVMDKAGDRWPVDGLVEDKWQALHSALVESADDIVSGLLVLIEMILPTLDKQEVELD